MSSTDFKLTDWIKIGLINMFFFWGSVAGGMLLLKLLLGEQVKEIDQLLVESRATVEELHALLKEQVGPTLVHIKETAEQIAEEASGKSKQPDQADHTAPRAAAGASIPSRSAAGQEGSRFYNLCALLVSLLRGARMVYTYPVYGYGVAVSRRPKLLALLSRWFY